MAAGIFAPPGTDAGPCAKGACQHRDCAQAYADAESICRHCNKPIGFDVRFYSDGPGLWVHALCEELIIEREQEAK